MLHNNDMLQLPTLASIALGLFVISSEDNIFITLSVSIDLQQKLTVSITIILITDYAVH
jgi:hypothetical protein